VYTVDQQAEASIAIGVIAQDDIVNAAEAGGTVRVSGTTGGDVKAGDEVTLTVGESTYTATVQGDGSWSVDVAGSDLAGASQVVATVTGTDVAGNTADASSTRVYTVDQQAEASIAIGVIAQDDIVNAAEAGGTVRVSGTTGGDVKAGDEVTLTVGESTYTATVQGDGSWSVDVAGSDLAGASQVVAARTSTRVTSSNAEARSAGVCSVDKQAEASIAIGVIAQDATVNAAEALSLHDALPISGGDVKAGDEVTLTVGESTYTATVQGDGSWSVDVAGSDLAGASQVV